MNESEMVILFYRSSKLPPDLHMEISDIILQIGDWEMECKLNKNHQLMCDEWRESDIRKRVLDQKVSDIRNRLGEMLPAKQVMGTLKIFCKEK